MVLPEAKKRTVSRTTGEAEESSDSDDDEELHFAEKRATKAEKSAKRAAREEVAFSSSDEEDNTKDKPYIPGRQFDPQRLKRQAEQKARLKALKNRKPRNEAEAAEQERELEEEEALIEKSSRYMRGAPEASYRRYDNTKTRAQLKQAERRRREAAKKAALSELLLADEAGYLEGEGDIERTERVKQSEIVAAVDIQSARKGFELKLSQMGPYHAAYSRNGRSLLLAGQKGHVAVMEWNRGLLQTEIQVKQAVRDAVFLHDESLFAVAQYKYVYIYDRDGVELHCLRSHINPFRLEFLPYHFLLASVGPAGTLVYQDVSTGQLVANQQTKLGPCHSMRQNPTNAILHLGHSEGTVTLWSPNVSQPLVKVLCHKGPLADLAVDSTGSTMVTSGLDGRVKFWDLRNTYANVHSMPSIRPATTVALSQRGLLALGFGPHVQVWPAEVLKGYVPRPYMRSFIPGETVSNLAFCPYEDVLGCGHSDGFQSLLIPGAGEPNYDTFEANPFQTSKQRREHQVHQLLDKVQPSMIAIDTRFIGQLDPRSAAKIAEEKKQRQEQLLQQKEAVLKKRGKHPGLRAKRRKDIRVRAEKTEALHAKHEERSKAAAESSSSSASSSALDRFIKKRRT